MFPSLKWEGDAVRPGQHCCSGLPRRVGRGGSKSISISALSPAARSAPGSPKAVSFSFTAPFIQSAVNNADFVPDFVREASALAPSCSRLCFQALFFFNYFSGIFPPLEAEAPYIPWIWATSNTKSGLRVGREGRVFSFSSFSIPLQQNFPSPWDGEGKDERDWEPLPSGGCVIKHTR